MLRGVRRRIHERPELAYEEVGVGFHHQLARTGVVSSVHMLLTRTPVFIHAGCCFVTH